jgi:crotonobetainyl-CoA:carnitine CoA-transferase CaiB-like acyl-CoA transferase
MDEPLTGMKVLDLSRLLPGPYCTLLLADLGADVIKIEEPGKGDYMRELIPGVYEAVNRNKRSVTLNLKSKEGCNIFYRMARNADVLVESFRPNVTTKIGIDYSTIEKINPSIIYCSISGYGQDGPYRDRPGHDINYLGIAGALSIPGEINKKPGRPGLPIGDLSSGLLAAFSILAAMTLRGKTGKGQYIDVAMTDGLISWMSVRAGDFLLGESTPLQKDEMGHLSPSNAVFRTKDKKEITIGAVENMFWVKLCEALNLNEFLESEDYSTNIKRVKKGKEIYSHLQRLFLKKTRDEWIRILDEAGIPCGPVYSYHETFQDPHVKQRELFTQIQYKGGKLLKQVRFPVKFSNLKPRIYYPPPEIGEHTESVLLEQGFSREEIEALRDRGAIGVTKGNK